MGIHPALAIGPSSRIDIPESKMIIDESSPTNRLGVHGDSYRWPHARDREGKTVDMRFVLPPQSKTLDMHFATEFKEGWLAVTDTSAKIGFDLTFPPEVFKAIWLWLVYGGCRGLYCAAVEAWTGYPGSLAQALKEGAYTSLESGQSLTCETCIIGYDDLSQVSRITIDGKVEGS
ncbi:MAG: hypothetical protein ABSD49_03525 [Candidatus Bathyarchaeia archaeon]